MRNEPHMYEAINQEYVNRNPKASAGFPSLKREREKFL